MRRLRVRVDLLAIEEALEAYRVDRGSVPTTAETLEMLAKAETSRWAGRYLESLPKDPWGNSYSYTSDGQRYSVVSFGADGVRGGDDGNADIDLNALWADQS